MTQLEVLNKIHELIYRRQVAIEHEKTDHPHDIDTLRLMSSDLDTIMDAVVDAISEAREYPPSYDFVGDMQKSFAKAMEKDSSDGPVAPSDGWRMEE